MADPISKQDIENYAMSVWPDLLRQAKLEPESYSALTLKIRPTPGDARIVLLLRGRGCDSLIAKIEHPAQFSTWTADRFASQVEAHHLASRVFSENTTQHVPDLIHVDAQKESQVFEYVQGQSAHEMLEMAQIGLGDRHKILRQCGAWLGTFHDATFQSLKPVNPGYMLNGIAELKQQVEAGSVNLPQPELFVKCAEQIPALAEAVAGQSTRICAAHGDMHLRNILIVGDDTYGIDFGVRKAVPTGHDVGTFLLRFGCLFQDDLTPDDSGAISASNLDAFYAGYGQQYRDDPSLTYLFPIQILFEWSRMSKDKANRNSAAQKRYRGLVRMIPAVFDT